MQYPKALDQGGYIKINDSHWLFIFENDVVHRKIIMAHNLYVVRVLSIRSQSSEMGKSLTAS